MRPGCRQMRTALTASTMKVSIALCTYNGEKYLPGLLDSLAAQTRKPDEVVICDDASTDSTASLLSGLDERLGATVRVIGNPSNLGYLKNFEKAIGLCTGDVIATCDQDDIWRPQKIERLVREFEADPEVDFVFSDATVIDEAGKQIAGSLWESVGF